MSDLKTPSGKIEHFLEQMLFGARWLLAPFYFGLALSLFVLLIKFVMELGHLALHAFTLSESDTIDRGHCGTCFIARPLMRRAWRTGRHVWPS